ncbi:MAG: hypothetical protein ACREUQ_11545 [Burkholderiales bacterium]
MRLITLIAVALLAGLAGCSTPPTELARSPSILIDQPTPPFPYNSRFCP